jgi:hypothetical protein
MDAASPIALVTIAETTRPATYSAIGFGEAKTLRKFRLQTSSTADRSRPVPGIGGGGRPSGPVLAERCSLYARAGSVLARAGGTLDAARLG